MHSALVYLPGERLSLTELMAARLDGLVVEVGPAYMPFDTFENARARAASLRGHLGTYTEALAFVGVTAAWVHGALPELPRTIHVQRTGTSFSRPRGNPALHYHQASLASAARERLEGVWVATPERTLIDLCRRPDLGGAQAAAGMLLAHPHLGGAVRDQLGAFARGELANAERAASDLGAEQAGLLSLLSPDTRRTRHRYGEPH